MTRKWLFLGTKHKDIEFTIMGNRFIFEKLRQFSFVCCLNQDLPNCHRLIFLPLIRLIVSTLYYIHIYNIMYYIHLFIYILYIYTKLVMSFLDLYFYGLLSKARILQTMTVQSKLLFCHEVVERQTEEEVPKGITLKCRGGLSSDSSAQFQSFCRECF